MKSKFVICLWLGCIAFSTGTKAEPDPPVKEGRAIFQSRCASCHNVNKVLTGPALAGVDERRSIDWIINFVHSSQAMVKKGDPQAVALFEKFNKIPMPDHPDLTAENIKDVVEFIKSESKTAGESSAPFAKPSSKKPNYVPLSLTRDFWPVIGLLGAILMLVATLLFAVKVSFMKKAFESRKAANSPQAGS